MPAKHRILVADAISIPVFDVHFYFAHHLVGSLLLPGRTAIVNPDKFIEITLLSQVAGAILKTEQITRCRLIFPAEARPKPSTDQRVAAAPVSLAIRARFRIA